MKRSKARMYLNSLFESYTYNIKENLAARWGLLWSILFIFVSLVAHYLHDYNWFPNTHIIHWLVSLIPFVFFPLIGATGTLEVKEGFEKSKQLKWSNIRYETLVKNLPDIVYSASPDNRLNLRFISPHIEALSGYTSEDFYSSPGTFQEIIHPDDKELFLKTNKQINKPVKLQYRIIHRKTKEYSYVLDHSIPIIEDNKIIAIEGIIFDITNEIRGKDRLKALTRELINTQETERQRIAKELHDELGQALYTIKINLNLLEKNQRASFAETESFIKKTHSIINMLTNDLKGISNDLDIETTLNSHIKEFTKMADQLKKSRVSNTSEIEELIKKNYSIVDMLTIDLKRIALDLRPSMLDDLGLESTLRWYITEFKKRAHIDVNYKIYGIKKRLPIEIEIALYRIVQESLTNIAKHASANKIKIFIKGENNKIGINIADNGCGFVVEKAFNPETRGISFGIMGIQERVRNFGGDFEIISENGKGTKLSLYIPVNL